MTSNLDIFNSMTSLGCESVCLCWDWVGPLTSVFSVQTEWTFSQDSA